MPKAAEPSARSTAFEIIWIDPTNESFLLSSLGRAATGVQLA
jgi:hypothetical protein